MTKLYLYIYSYVAYFHCIIIVLTHKKCMQNTNKNDIYIELYNKKYERFYFYNRNRDKKETEV